MEEAALRPERTCLAAPAEQPERTSTGPRAAARQHPDFEPEPESEPSPLTEEETGPERSAALTQHVAKQEQVAEGVPPARASPPPVSASIAGRVRTAGHSERTRVAALEDALRRQADASERREQVLKKQHRVALLGQKSYHSAELARRDDQIARLEKAVQTQQQQHRRKDAEILRLRRQIERKTVKAGGVDRPQLDDVDVVVAAPDAIVSLRSRWSTPRSLLTIVVFVIVFCAFVIAVPGGAYTLHSAVAGAGLWRRGSTCVPQTETQQQVLRQPN